MAKDLRESIKGERKSHLSVPIGNDAEFHLRLEELNMKPVKATKYYLCYPVECVSDNEKGKTSSGEDKDMARFVQLGNPKLEALETSDDKIRKAAKKTYRS